MAQTGDYPSYTQGPQGDETEFERQLREAEEKRKQSLDLTALQPLPAPASIQASQQDPVYPDFEKGSPAAEDLKKVFHEALKDAPPVDPDVNKPKPPTPEQNIPLGGRLGTEVFIAAKPIVENQSDLGFRVLKDSWGANTVRLGVPEGTPVDHYAVVRPPVQGAYRKDRKDTTDDFITAREYWEVTQGTRERPGPMPTKDRYLGAVELTGNPWEKAEAAGMSAEEYRKAVGKAIETDEAVLGLAYERLLDDTRNEFLGSEFLRGIADMFFNFGKKDYAERIYVPVFPGETDQQAIKRFADKTRQTTDTAKQREYLGVQLASSMTSGLGNFLPAQHESLKKMEEETAFNPGVLGQTQDMANIATLALWRWTPAGVGFHVLTSAGQKAGAKALSRGVSKSLFEGERAFLEQVAPNVSAAAGGSVVEKAIVEGVAKAPNAGKTGLGSWLYGWAEKVGGNSGRAALEAIPLGVKQDLGRALENVSRYGGKTKLDEAGNLIVEFSKQPSEEVLLGLHRAMGVFRTYAVANMGQDATLKMTVKIMAQQARTLAALGTGGAEATAAALNPNLTPEERVAAIQAIPESAAHFAMTDFALGQIHRTPSRVAKSVGPAAEAVAKGARSSAIFIRDLFKKGPATPEFAYASAAESRASWPKNGPQGEGASDLRQPLQSINVNPIGGEAPPGTQGSIDTTIDQIDANTRGKTRRKGSAGQPLRPLIIRALDALREKVESVRDADYKRQLAPPQPEMPQPGMPPLAPPAAETLDMRTKALQTRLDAMRDLTASSDPTMVETILGFDPFPSVTLADIDPNEAATMGQIRWASALAEEATKQAMPVGTINALPSDPSNPVVRMKAVADLLIKNNPEAPIRPPEGIGVTDQALLEAPEPSFARETPPTAPDNGFKIPTAEDWVRDPVQAERDAVIAADRLAVGNPVTPLGELRITGDTKGLSIYDLDRAPVVLINGRIYMFVPDPRASETSGKNIMVDITNDSYKGNGKFLEDRDVEFVPSAATPVAMTQMEGDRLVVSPALNHAPDIVERREAYKRALNREAGVIPDKPWRDPSDILDELVMRPPKSASETAALEEALNSIADEHVKRIPKLDLVRESWGEAEVTPLVLEDFSMRLRSYLEQAAYLESSRVIIKSLAERFRRGETFDTAWLRRVYEAGNQPGDNFPPDIQALVDARRSEVSSLRAEADLEKQAPDILEPVPTADSFEAIKGRRNRVVTADGRVWNVSSRKGEVSISYDPSDPVNAQVKNLFNQPEVFAGADEVNSFLGTHEAREIHYKTATEKAAIEKRFRNATKYITTVDAAARLVFGGKQAAEGAGFMPGWQGILETPLKPGDKITRKELAARQEVGDTLADKGVPGVPQEVYDARMEAYLQRAELEISKSLAKPGHGLEWYGSQMETLHRALYEKYPEMDPDSNPNMDDAVANEVIFKAILAVTSNGMSVRDNMKTAFSLYDAFREKGQIPELPDKESGISFGTRPGSIAAGLKFINGLVAYFEKESPGQGKLQAANWLVSKVRVGDRNDPGSMLYMNMMVTNPPGEDGLIRPATGDRGISTFEEGLPSSDTVFIGGTILGPKVGRFFANLNGFATETTVDRWLMRTFNRWMGRLALDYDTQKVGIIQPSGRNAVDPKTGKALTIKAPSNVVLNDTVPPEARTRIFDMFNRISTRTGLSPMQIQALLWYYEKDLYTAMGTDPSMNAQEGFGDAAIRHARDSGLIRRGKDGIEYFTRSGRAILPEHDRARLGIAPAGSLDRVGEAGGGGPAPVEGGVLGGSPAGTPDTVQRTRSQQAATAVEGALALEADPAKPRQLRAGATSAEAIASLTEAANLIAPVPVEQLGLKPWEVTLSQWAAICQKPIEDVRPDFDQVVSAAVLLNVPGVHESNKSRYNAKAYIPEDVEGLGAEARRALAFEYAIKGYGFSREPMLFEALSEQDKVSALHLQIASGHFESESHFETMNPANWDKGRRPKYFEEWQPSAQDKATLQQTWDIRKQHIAREVETVQRIREIAATRIKIVREERTAKPGTKETEQAQAWKQAQVRKKVGLSEVLNWEDLNSIDIKTLDMLAEREPAVYAEWARQFNRELPFFETEIAGGSGYYGTLTKAEAEAALNDLLDFTAGRIGRENSTDLDMAPEPIARAQSMAEGNTPGVGSSVRGNLHQYFTPFDAIGPGRQLHTAKQYRDAVAQGLMDRDVYFAIEGGLRSLEQADMKDFEATQELMSLIVRNHETKFDKLPTGRSVARLEGEGARLSQDLFHALNQNWDPARLTDPKYTYTLKTGRLSEKKMTLAEAVNIVKPIYEKDIKRISERMAETVDGEAALLRAQLTQIQSEKERQLMSLVNFRLGNMDAAARAKYNLPDHITDFSQLPQKGKYSAVYFQSNARKLGRRAVRTFDAKNTYQLQSYRELEELEHSLVSSLRQKEARAVAIRKGGPEREGYVTYLYNEYSEEAGRLMATDADAYLAHLSRRNPHIRDYFIEQRNDGVEREAIKYWHLTYPIYRRMTNRKLHLEPAIEKALRLSSAPGYPTPQRMYVEELVGRLKGTMPGPERMIDKIVEWESLNSLGKEAEKFRKKFGMTPQEALNKFGGRPMPRTPNWLSSTAVPTLYSLYLSPRRVSAYNILEMAYLLPMLFNDMHPLRSGASTVWGGLKGLGTVLGEFGANTVGAKLFNTPRWYSNATKYGVAGGMHDFVEGINHFDVMKKAEQERHAAYRRYYEQGRTMPERMGDALRYLSGVAAMRSFRVYMHLFLGTATDKLNRAVMFNALSTKYRLAGVPEDAAYRIAAANTKRFIASFDETSQSPRMRETVPRTLTLLQRFVLGKIGWSVRNAGIMGEGLDSLTKKVGVSVPLLPKRTDASVIQPWDDTRVVPTEFNKEYGNLTPGQQAALAKLMNQPMPHGSYFSSDWRASLSAAAQLGLFVAAAGGQMSVARRMPWLLNTGKIDDDREKFALWNRLMPFAVNKSPLLVAQFGIDVMDVANALAAEKVGGVDLDDPKLARDKRNLERAKRNILLHGMAFAVPGSAPLIGMYKRGLDAKEKKERELRAAYNR